MNDREIEATLDKLALPTSERKTIVKLAKPPRTGFIVAAGVWLLIGVLEIAMFWGEPTVPNSRPAKDELISAQDAYDTAKRSERTFVGYFHIALGIVIGVNAYMDGRRNRAIRALVSSIAAKGPSMVAILGLIAAFQITSPTSARAEDPKEVAIKAKAAADGAKAVCNALKTYMKELGAFPTGDTAQIMAALTSGINAKRILFFMARQNAFNAKGEFLDPWGTPYRMGKFPTDVPWAYSCGPNKSDEGGIFVSDDIVSWR